MMLGTDVSSLTTTTADAAAQGLSIVIPVYNEGAGLSLLHERLTALAPRSGNGLAFPCTSMRQPRLPLGANAWKRFAARALMDFLPMSARFKHIRRPEGR